MSAPTTSDPQKPSYLSALTVYLRPGVLVIMLLGFSSGLPLALSGETLRVWMADSGVDLGTIGLLALAGLPVHAEIHLGTGGGRLAGAGAVAPLRPPPRLAHRLAARAHGGDRVPRHARPDQRPVDDRPRRADRRLRLGDPGHRRRRLPRAVAARRRAGRRHGRLRRRLPHRHAGVGRRRHRFQRLAGDVWAEQGGRVAARLRRRGAARARRPLRRHHRA